MSKYIGTPVVNLSVDTVDVTGDITATDSTPELILLNDTHEDTDGGREGKVTFKGEQSGGEVTVLAQIQSGHDGTSDDQKGDLIFKTNDGSDGSSPTEALRIDSSQNVGIGTTSPTTKLQSKGGSISTPTDNDELITNASASFIVNHSNEYGLYTGYTNSSNDAIGVAATRSGGGALPLSLQPFGGSVGIGTTSPRAKTEVFDSGVSAAFNAGNLSTWRVMQVRNNIESTTGTAAGIALGGDGGSDTETAGIVGISDNSTGGVCQLGFIVSAGNNSAEAMRINSDGQVLVGSTSTSFSNSVATFATSNNDSSVSNGAGAAISIKNTNTTDGNYSTLYFENSAGGVDSAIYGVHGDADGTGTSRVGTLVFATANSGGGVSERMRIDSNGKVLIGKTSTAFSVAGVRFDSIGLAEITRDGNTPLHINRTSSDGGILAFYKDGTQEGAITTAQGNIQLVSGGVGVGVGDDNIYPVNGSGVAADNQFDLGDSSVRFDDVFATNGTIQTSDENEKQNIASLTSAEITAATAISKLFKTFKWKDKVAAKGDSARTHTGVIAQQVETAMSDAGLDAGDYAFFISTTWWEKDVEVAAVTAVEAKDAVYDDDGKLVSEAVEAVEAADAYTRTDTYDTQEEAPEGATERNRKGIRYPELLAFIGAATEQRLTSIEARLTALEGE